MRGRLAILEGPRMRTFLVGVVAAALFSVVNGTIFYFRSGQGSFLTYEILDLVPIDWLLIGAWMGIAIGLAHRRIQRANNVSVFIAGAAGALLCTLTAHVTQFLLYKNWDL